MRNFNSIIKYGWHSSFSLVKATLMSVLLFCLCGKFNCRDEYYGCHVSALFVDNVRHFWFGFHCQPFCRYHIVYLRHFFFPLAHRQAARHALCVAHNITVSSKPWSVWWHAKISKSNLNYKCKKKYQSNSPNRKNSLL